MQGLHTYNISPHQHYPISSAVAVAASGRLPAMSSFVSRKLSPRRNSSFELDVFDAKRYFSTAIVDDDTSTFIGYPEPARHQKAATEKKSFGTSGSAYAPVKGKGSFSTSSGAPVKGKGSCTYNKCTTKQPTSPGLRLASFINSLFQQAASKRKPKPSAPNTPTTAPQKSRSNEAVYSCVSSGFTTPCLQLSTRSYVHREKSRYRSDTNQYRKEPEEAAYRPYAKNGIWLWKEDKYVPRGDHGLYGNVYDGDQSVCEERRWVLNSIHKYRDDHHGYLMKRDWSWVGESTPRQRKSFKRSTEDVEEYCGEDWESDSSSDLFELKIDNSDLHRHGGSGGLPVFGTTNMKAFKRGIAIATVAS